MVVSTRKLGRNGPTVSALGLGLMGMSVFYGPPPTDEQLFATLDKAIEEGCTFWDSSDFYGDNSERLQRYFAARGNRDKVFLCTKVSNWFNEDGSISVSSEPDYIRKAGEKVLQRLGLPYIDLLYMHRADGKVPIEKSIAALAEFVKEGKVGHIGLTEVSAATIRRAHAVHPLAAVQAEYSAFSLDIETNGVLETCRELGIAVIPYSPVSRGFLTGEIKSRDGFAQNDLRRILPRFSEVNFPKNLEVVEKLAEGARKRGVTTTQFALAWLLAQGDDIIPIPGTTKAARIVENMGALKITVSPEEDREIREILATITGSRYPSPIGLYADTPEL